jgi:hypothetical protein
MSIHDNPNYFKEHIIYLDNGRWNPRSYLQVDGKWGDDPRTAAGFRTRREAYAFVRQSSAGIYTSANYSKFHACHRWY